MTPTGVLTKHLDLVSHLEDTRFAAVVKTCFGLAWDAGTQGRNVAPEMPQYLANKFGQGVRAAADYYVTADMVQLVRHAADSLDDEDFMDISLTPTSSGFVRFEVPISLIDVRGRTLKAHYLTWAPVAGSNDDAVLMTWWNDAQDPDDVEAEFVAGIEGSDAEFLRALGDWRWIGGDLCTTGRKLGPKVIVPSEKISQMVIAEGDTPSHEGTNMTRIAHALWLLLGQTITAVSEEKAERAVARRAMRKNLPSGVTVVQLRRVEHKGGLQGHAEVQWKHRWIVRGHWRWTHCGPKHRLAQEVSPGEYRARIWISPFVKGPEDAELVVTQKVYSLSR